MNNVFMPFLMSVQRDFHTIYNDILVIEEQRNKLEFDSTEFNFLDHKDEIICMVNSLIDHAHELANAKCKEFTDKINNLIANNDKLNQIIDERNTELALRNSRIKTLNEQNRELRDMYETPKTINLKAKNEKLENRIKELKKMIDTNLIKKLQDELATLREKSQYFDMAYGLLNDDYNRSRKEREQLESEYAMLKDKYTELIKENDKFCKQAEKAKSKVAELSIQIQKLGSASKKQEGKIEVLRSKNKELRKSVADLSKELKEFKPDDLDEPKPEPKQNSPPKPQHDPHKQPPSMSKTVKTYISQAKIANGQRSTANTGGQRSTANTGGQRSTANTGGQRSTTNGSSVSIQMTTTSGQSISVQRANGQKSNAGGLNIQKPTK